MRVVVIGGGLGGLCLAQGLRLAGVDVAVYERDDSPTSREQGYRVHIDRRGEGAMRSSLPPAVYERHVAARGQPSRGMTVFRPVDGRLREVFARRFPEDDADAFVTVGHAVDRLTLRRVLLTGLEDAVRFGREFVRFERRDDGGIRAHFAGGTWADGDVLVAADGAGSRVRQQYLPDARVDDTGMRWLGGKTPLTDELRSLLPERLAETFGVVPGLAGASRGMLFGLVELPADPYVFWGVLVEREQVPVPDDQLLAMPGAELRRLTLGLEPNWPPALRALVERTLPDHEFVLRIRCAVPLERWRPTSVTLLGDAIHVMPPRGSGANSALGDASRLCRGLVAAARGETPLLRAIEDYEVDMLRHGFDAIRAAQAEGLGIPPIVRR
jgi:2-polyprenyl-6-methoxyphenol hydroxylase-like FAD-dependent oxidoreductase